MAIKNIFDFCETIITHSKNLFSYDYPSVDKLITKADAVKPIKEPLNKEPVVKKKKNSLFASDSGENKINNRPESFKCEMKESSDSIETKCFKINEPNANRKTKQKKKI